MKKRLFLDTNIVLDLLAERNPFYTPIAQIATMADKKKLLLYCSPLTFATVNYFLSKYESTKIANQKLSRFRIICEVTYMDEKTVDKGLKSSFNDFEDTLQYYLAISSDCDIIISRNAKDFKASTIPVMSAGEFLKSL